MFQVRFLADLVNCHVISAGSMVNFLQALADVSGETGIPQVSLCKFITFKNIHISLKVQLTKYHFLNYAHFIFTTLVL